MGRWPWVAVDMARGCYLTVLGGPGCFLGPRAPGPSRLHRVAAPALWGAGAEAVGESLHQVGWALQDHRGPIRAGCPCCCRLLTFFLTLSLSPLRPWGVEATQHISVAFLPTPAKLFASPSFCGLVWGQGNLILWVQSP